jgi:hypothetical protein
MAIFNRNFPGRAGHTREARKKPPAELGALNQNGEERAVKSWCRSPVGKRRTENHAPTRRGAGASHGRVWTHGHGLVRLEESI